LKRFEPNLLLAITTACATALLIMTTTVFEPADPWWRYGLTAVVVVVAYLALQPLSRRMFKSDPPPMIIAGAPQTALWAAIIPGLILLMASLPLIFAGISFGLAVVIASVFTGGAIRSAMKARAGG
jgi:hypothetical protein